MVDAFSRFPIVKLVPSMSASILVCNTRNVFADFGIPEIIVSDNERQLTFHEFPFFFAKNGVKYLNTPPFHRSLNGLVERAVRRFKKLWREHTTYDVSIKLARILFAMRIAVCSTAGQVTAQMFYSNLFFRSPYDAIHPPPETIESQHCQDEVRQFKVGDAVRFRDYRTSKPH